MLRKFAHTHTHTPCGSGTLRLSSVQNPLADSLPSRALGQVTRLGGNSRDLPLPASFVLLQPGGSQPFGVTKEDWLGIWVATWVTEVVGHVCASANPHGYGGQLISLGSDPLEGVVGKLVATGSALRLNVDFGIANAMSLLHGGAVTDLLSATCAPVRCAGSHRSDCGLPSRAVDTGPHSREYVRRDSLAQV